MLESPSFSQGRESLLSELSEHEAASQLQPGSLPSHPYQVSSLPSLSLALEPQTNPFKRPYPSDAVTPVSSPNQHAHHYHHHQHHVQPHHHQTQQHQMQHNLTQQHQQPPPTKRRKSTSKEAWTMTEDDNLLLQLKDEQGHPWKVIQQRFREMGRGEFRVPTLQMRYKRLKEKMRVWDADDVGFSFIHFTTSPPPASLFIYILLNSKEINY
jgi:hypothetical protein